MNAARVFDAYKRHWKLSLKNHVVKYPDMKRGESSTKIRPWLKSILKSAILFNGIQGFWWSNHVPRVMKLGPSSEASGRKGQSARPGGLTRQDEHDPRWNIFFTLSYESPSDIDVKKPNNLFNRINPSVFIKRRIFSQLRTLWQQPWAVAAKERQLEYGHIKISLSALATRPCLKLDETFPTSTLKKTGVLWVGRLLGGSTWPDWTRGPDKCDIYFHHY